MNWQIFLAITIISAAISALLQKVVMRKQSVSPVAFAAGFQLLVSLLIGVILLFKGFHFPLIKPIILNLLAMPPFYSFGNVARFNALKKVEASEYSVIFQLSTVVTVLAAILFLGEKFRLVELMGLALVIVAILLVTIRDQIKLKLSAGEFWALGSAVAFGLAFANDAYILRSFDLWSYTFLAFLAPGLLTLLYLGKDIKQLRDLKEKEIFVGFVFSAIAYAVMSLSIYYAYQIGHNAAQIASIFPTYSILVVVLAAIFLNERDFLYRKLTAAVLAVLGIILLQ